MLKTYQDFTKLPLNYIILYKHTDSLAFFYFSLFQSIPKFDVGVV